MPDPPAAEMHGGSSTPRAPLYPFERADPVRPAPALREVREERPVCPVTLPSGDRAHVVTRHRDALQVWTAPAFSLAARHRPGAPMFVPGPAVAVRGNLLSLDPPEHTRLRRLVAPLFSHHRVEALRPDLQRITDELLDHVCAAGPPVDLVTSLCAPLPIAMLGRVLGVPEDDQPRFAEWTDLVMEIRPGSRVERMAAWHALRSLLGGLIADRRRAPADDLLSRLAAEGLPDAEAVNLAVQVLVAGYETTLYQLAILLYVLLTSPDLRARLAGDPGTVPAAVEELSRLHPPANASMIRVATEDVDLGGTLVREGEGVLIDFTAVNRDAEVFSEAETLCPGRRDGQSLTYGHGPHYCLGAAMARAELQIAVAGFLRRLPDARLAVPPRDIAWRPSNRVVQGPVSLPVTW